MDAAVNTNLTYDGLLPSSPTRGEVPVAEHSVSAHALFTSPFMGEAGRGLSRLRFTA